METNIKYRLRGHLPKSLDPSLKEERNSALTTVEPFSVDIDFDEANQAWRENKKSLGNGFYTYICCADKNGKKCGTKCIQWQQYCRIHNKNFGSSST